MLGAAQPGDPVDCERQPIWEIWAQEAMKGRAQDTTGKDMGSGPRHGQAWLVDHGWQAPSPEPSLTGGSGAFLLWL